MSSSILELGNLRAGLAWSDRPSWHRSSFQLIAYRTTRHGSGLGKLGSTLSQLLVATDARVSLRPPSKSHFLREEAWSPFGGVKIGWKRVGPTLAIPMGSTHWLNQGNIARQVFVEKTSMGEVPVLTLLWLGRMSMNEGPHLGPSMLNPHMFSQSMVNLGGFGCNKDPTRASLLASKPGVQRRGAHQRGCGVVAQLPGLRHTPLDPPNAGAKWRGGSRHRSVPSSPTHGKGSKTATPAIARTRLRLVLCHAALDDVRLRLTSQTAEVQRARVLSKSLTAKAAEPQSPDASGVEGVGVK